MDKAYMAYRNKIVCEVRHMNNNDLLPQFSLLFD